MNILFANGRQNLGNKNIALTADTLKATLLSMTSTAGKVYTLSNATNATPIVVTTSSTAGITAGDIIVVGGVGGNLAANGTWQAGTVTGTTVQLLTRLDGGNSIGSAAYTSGGWMMDITSASTLSDVSANSSGTDPTLTSVTNTGGVINSANFTWTNPPATKVWGCAIYDSTASNDLIAWYDGTYQVYVITQASSSATSIAVARLGAALPNGSVITFSDGTTATLTAQANVGDTSLSVSSLAATVHAKSTADVSTLSAGFPVTPTGNNNLIFVPDSGPNKLFVV
ncbi:MAG TPA: hypothetical protein VMI75_36600 [Polyangiaceae bacterium]|nr:hypothetical protein [Polyangiaceae bacterium]